ncbi:MAG: polysaccharide deacetylase family protein, partial [bacterium]|nr:polysaccharide deacetylase family protein [bacterium]
HQCAVPIHEEYGVPGHLEAVAGHIGKIRKIGNSSYNGFRHMNGEEMQDMIARGWGVGNHSWSHEVIKPDMVDRELREAKEVLEEAIDGPVDFYCSPGNNTNMADHVLEACRKYGYLGAMSLTDALNRPDDELFWLNRTALHDQYYEPFYSEYDPFRNIRHAQEDGGWIIDYCHCPLEEVVHRNKDCSAPQLRRRFETVLTEGGDNVWCAVPEEVTFYHLTRRHTEIETLSETASEKRYRLKLTGLSNRVTCRALTLDAEVPAAWCRYPVVHVNNQPRPATLVRPGVLRITVDVEDGIEIVYSANMK